MPLTLSDFPDEVLAIILDFASLKWPRAYWDNVTRLYASAREIALVSRRFHRLVLPILYRSIVFPMILRDTENYMLLHRTLRENPTLRPLCRQLDVYIERDRVLDEEYYTIWNDLFAWMTRLHTLVFTLDLASGWNCGIAAGPDDLPTRLAWGLVRSAGSHMRELAVFQIEGLSSRINIRDVVKEVRFTSLEKLQVVNARETEDGPACVEPKDYQTASFKTLDLVDTNVSLDTIAQLIKWPEELVHFSTKCPTIYDADLSVFHSPLSFHRDTLKTIEIGFYFSGRAGALFNAADFPCLEKLALPRTMMGSLQEGYFQPFLQWSPDHADLLLGPKLHTFTWLFEGDGPSCLQWHKFADQEESWLRSLMKEAVARGSALRTIRVEYSPEIGYAVPQEYPWDRMDCLNEEFEPYGLTLEYCDPPMTRSEWQVMLDEPFDPFDVSSESFYMEE